MKPTELLGCAFLLTAAFVAGALFAAVVLFIGGKPLLEVVMLAGVLVLGYGLLSGRRTG